MSGPAQPSMRKLASHHLADGGVDLPSEGRQLLADVRILFQQLLPRLRLVQQESYTSSGTNDTANAARDAGAQPGMHQQ